MSAPLHILMPSDVFPPRCGGAGWSAHALALALIERGHTVRALVPQQNQHGISEADVLGVPTTRWGYRTPRIPFVQNYARHERLWPRFAELLTEQGHSAQQVVIHAQHVQVTPPSVLAGQRLRAPVLVTVRDHWPWDYFATGLHADRVPLERQTWATLATDLPQRLGALRGTLALPAIPYMLRHLHRRQRYLRRADAVIAVSDYIAQRLAPIVAPERLHVLPNMLDIDAIERVSREWPTSVPTNQRYLLYVGKLERNKGAQVLLESFRSLDASQRAALAEHTLVLAGNGSLQSTLQRELAALGISAQFLDWVDHDETLRLMAHCEVLLFPSAWGEPLSRVMLEGLACGAPILAMPTGGTPSAITDGVNGALEPTPAGFARRLLALLAQPQQRAALGEAARQRARTRYARSVVVAQVESLYYGLLASR
jgi:glycogen(starch) synthase